MKKDYHFKRNFYYDAEKAIQRSSISFILGTRKCGKTVCMHQLHSAFSNSTYVDMKADFDSDEQRRKFVSQILEDIINDKEIIYFIDETTYMALPDKEIARIAGMFSEYDNHKTKIVFSGSQSMALEFWGHLACGGNASFIRTGFLSYPEWLAYKGTTEISERTYLDFLFHVREFYSDFTNTKEYLQGCLDETVISNRKSIEYVIGNDCENLNVEMLLDVLYASLVKLHNHTNYQRFSDSKLFHNMLAYYFGDELSAIEKDEQIRRIADIFESRYQNFKNMSGLDCKSAMRFLSNCGLITLTYVSDELTADPYIAEKLLKESSELYTKPQIFSQFNLTINYPMFYMDLLKNVLRERMTDTLPKDLLGSIVECHVRSLLPTTGCFEYRDSKGTEIDYVSLNKKAIEISISNKRMRNVNLQMLPNDYHKEFLLKKYD